MPLKVLEVHFECAGSQNLLGRGGCLSRLRTRSLFVAGARETLRFGGAKSTFRDR